MPTIQQLVRYERLTIKRKQNLQHYNHARRDAGFVHVFIRQRQKNQIQRCVKLLVFV